MNNGEEQLRNKDEDIAIMTDNIIHDMVAYFNDSRLQSAVVGLSGGIDSTLTAMLARLAFRHKAIARPIRLIGVVMPIATNKPVETIGGKTAAAVLCDQGVTADFTWLYRAAALAISPANILKTPSKRTHMEKIRLGNLKARIRMLKLYDMAGKYQGLVLSTDNLTEYYLGFWTLHGDVGDFAPIQNLWKTEVYKTASRLRDMFALAARHPDDPAVAWLWREFNWDEGKDNRFRQMAKVLDDAIQAIPTDGLGITHSDFDQLGVDNYEAVDLILLRILRGEAPTTAPEKIIFQRYIASAHKRKNPYCVSRGIICKGTCAPKEN